MKGPQNEYFSKFSTFLDTEGCGSTDLNFCWEKSGFFVGYVLLIFCLFNDYHKVKHYRGASPPPFPPPPP